METGNNSGEHWETAGACLAELIQTFGETIRLDDAPYNINVPNRPLRDLAGVRVTNLSTHSCLDNYQLAMTNGEHLHVQRVWHDRSSQPVPSTDTWAVANGYVSLTRLRLLREASFETTAPRPALPIHPTPPPPANKGLTIPAIPNRP